MKKLAAGVGIGAAAVVLVATGWWLGMRQKYLTEAYAVTALDREITDTAYTFRMLQDIENGRADEVRHLFQLRLDGHIATIDNLIDSGDERSREMAQKIFTGILEMRKQNPPKYLDSMAHPDAEMQARVMAMLQRVSTNGIHRK